MGQAAFHTVDLNVFIPFVFNDHGGEATVRADGGGIRLAAHVQLTDYRATWNMNNHQRSGRLDKTLGRVDTDQRIVTCYRDGSRLAIQFNKSISDRGGGSTDVDKPEALFLAVRIDQCLSVLGGGDNFRHGFVLALIAIFEVKVFMNGEGGDASKIFDIAISSINRDAVCRCNGGSQQAGF